MCRWPILKGCRFFSTLRLEWHTISEDQMPWSLNPLIRCATMSTLSHVLAKERGEYLSTLAALVSSLELLQNLPPHLLQFPLSYASSTRLRDVCPWTLELATIQENVIAKPLVMLGFGNIHLSQKCLCLVMSPCLRKVFPHSHTKGLSWDNFGSTTASLPPVCHFIYSFSASLRPLLTILAELVPILSSVLLPAGSLTSGLSTSSMAYIWHALCLPSSPNSIIFGSLSPSMRPLGGPATAVFCP